MAHPLILLATYNGAPYLAEQIRSIQRQSFSDWQLLARDDGSSDQTPAILRGFAAEDSRIKVLEDNRLRLGVTGNFNALCEAALKTPSNYFFFADQDDVWHPDKLGLQLACLQAAQRNGGDGPMAVHSDLAVVDAGLRPVHPSFLRFQGLWHESDNPLATLVVQNFVTGCTLLVNRALLESAVPFPAEAVMHDWWLALCAAAAGRLEFVPQAMVQYRQHGRNAIGAKRWWSPALWSKLRHPAAPARAAALQAVALRQRLRHVMPEGRNLRLLVEYGRLMAPESGLWTRIRGIRRLGIHRQGRLRQALLLTALTGQYVKE